MAKGEGVWCTPPRGTVLPSAPTQMSDSALFHLSVIQEIMIIASAAVIAVPQFLI